MQRPRPTPDLQFVFRPESDAAYRHFEGHETVPFDAAATTATRAHAWWLAEAALLAYWDPAVAVARFAAAGLTAELIENGDTQVYVAASTDAVIVAFRGTESDRFGDLFDDLGFALAPWPDGKVHAGFLQALERVWTPLVTRLNALAATRSVWFCGHSLGATLATLAADRFPQTAGACTIGSPRVGNRVFAAAFDARFEDRVLRYVNDTDIVTHVPPPLLLLPYAHVGRLRQITPNGRITDQAPALAHFVRDVFGDVGHLQDVVTALQAGTMHRAPDFLLDHMPRGYTVDIWNDLDAHGPT
ncbi:MAG: lipase family protein [Vicinamibacteraceae bacterium]